MAVINGMDDVIKYIKDQDETIKKLKEENEGLKKKLDEGTEQHLAQTKKLNNFYMKTKEENEKLKTKIKDLDEKIEEQEYEIEEQREIINDLDEYKDKFEDMEEELANKSLEFKEKIEDSESTMRGAMDGFMKCQKDYDTLKSKIDAFKQKLKDTNDLDEEDEGWMETWDIIETTLKINTAGDDTEEIDDEDNYECGKCGQVFDCKTDQPVDDGSGCKKCMPDDED